jgi:glycosyltransferase involved in cell wall biosynthesis
MAAPKILAVASSMDLRFRYGCTPAWWQLWKGLYEAGAELIVTPYRGRALEAPWWRTYENPCYREGEAYALARQAAARLRGEAHLRRAEQAPPDTPSDRVARQAIWRWVTPRWRKHLERILSRESGVDAVIVFTVPMSHVRGIPALLRERFSVPVVYYDGDVPMSLPEFGGMDTGFNIYHGADPSEYDLVLSNSEGGRNRLLELGARQAETLFWGADPELFSPLPVAKERDVFFYGYGDKFRAEWMDKLIAEPSRRLPEVDFALGGGDFRSDTGRAREIGPVPFNGFRRAISASRINLNITRHPHAATYASSTSRPFELAAAGAAIVSNPHAGMERWFEPGQEMLIASTSDAAVDAYRNLLADPAAAEDMGRRARARALDEHTYVQRARRLLELIGLPSPTKRTAVHA